MPVRLSLPACQAEAGLKAGSRLRTQAREGMVTVPGFSTWLVSGGPADSQRLFGCLSGRGPLVSEISFLAEKMLITSELLFLASHVKTERDPCLLHKNANFF